MLFRLWNGIPVTGFSLQAVIVSRIIISQRTQHNFDKIWLKIIISNRIDKNFDNPTPPIFVQTGIIKKSRPATLTACFREEAFSLRLKSFVLRRWSISGEIDHSLNPTVSLEDESFLNGNKLGSLRKYWSKRFLYSALTH